MAELTIAEVARVADGEVEGDPGLTVRGVKPLDEAGPGDLSFVAEPRYFPYIAASQARALLVARGSDAPVEGRTVIRVDDPRRALARILAALHPEERPAPGVHPTAVVGEGVEIDPTATVGAYAVIGDGSVIGARARISAHVVVGRGCRVDADALIHPHVTLYDGVSVGERSVIHSGARLGSDGFGFVPEGGRLVKVPQVGGCRIEADVEVGANTTIDRGSIGDTVVGRGTKIDNLVQIGHNCRIGRSVVIVSQAGISGSTKVGDGAVLGGQSGFQGHIEVGAGARIGAQAGVTASVAPGETVSGYPARPHREALRVQAATFKLPELMRRVKELERAVLGKGAAGS
ncbi:UDP-3-O-(3-hydroxymyristoyl)glucosamine N-acyltransferase [Longimicrobium sp.]|uniref:UDP-3-O-(3-hydroxymyristoyl)glucosamine N-acyltransferase n=1 Tax=Longimicrobium sp. TaxID=2029185 RepID=UPI002C18E422|nr:UDP-3-O-(3-hydroxymyristoyl)glucosamine N-acyltransferase [Longimicrobium sp.]HSU14363.1 UDP-3-O-(3-hydroxymyristoyl)glucosamine N-acyltransferase [Longimicrobium sp.]